MKRLILTFLLLFLVSAGTAASDAVRITLLQVNDVYQLTPVDKGKRGGMARLASRVRQIRGESPNTVFVLGGDTISPSVASKIFKGRQMIDGWNHAGLDLAVLGNHEFDFGEDVLAERMSESRFTWLGANVVDARSGKPLGGARRFQVRDMGGVKVGFFGVITPETAHASHPGEHVRFLDPIATAREVVAEMRREGATVVVAVTHQSMHDDKRLARAVPVDVILGGHEHTWLQGLANGTPIFKMSSDARLLGRVDLEVVGGRVQSMDWTAIPIDDTVPEDPTVAEVVRRYEAQLQAELGQPVGRTGVVLDALQRTNRSQETNLADYVADAYRRHTKAQAAILNGGSIRSNTTYGPGELTRRDVLSILPFENPIVKLEVSGAVIRRAIEHGLSKVHEGDENGAFPQVSGIRYVYDPARPAGERVVELTIDGRPLDPGAAYSLAINSFLLNGGDGYGMFKGARLLMPPELAQVEPAVVTAVLAEDGVIAPRLDGRIRRLGQQDAR